jgi:hypothetical protein
MPFCFDFRAPAATMAGNGSIQMAERGRVARLHQRRRFFTYGTGPAAMFAGANIAEFAIADNVAAGDDGHFVGVLVC